MASTFHMLICCYFYSYDNFNSKSLKTSSRINAIRSYTKFYSWTTKVWESWSVKWCTTVFFNNNFKFLFSCDWLIFSLYLCPRYMNFNPLLISLERKLPILMPLSNYIKNGAFSCNKLAPPPPAMWIIKTKNLF